METGQPLPPPLLSRGAVAWLRENLFSEWYNGLLTLVAAGVIGLALFYGLRWIIVGADWTVISTLGGRMIIGQYNIEAACPGQNCFWRPQAVLLMATALLGMGWGVVGGGLTKRIAIGVAVVLSLFALLPYGFDTMGLDVRLLLAANLPALGLGWAIARYTPLGTLKRLSITIVVAFIVGLVLLRGLPGVPGLQTVSVLYWGGLMLNLLLAVAGITISLPIGIALALGRRSNLPVVKLLCVVFIEVFRGVPLITLLFMSQVLVPLAFPENFPQNSLFRARHNHHLVQFGLHGREHPGWAAGPEPGAGRGGPCPGAGQLADYPADFPAPGHSQRDTRHRRPVHRPVQGHKSGLYHRHVGRGGDKPGLHPG